jgi:hypothetical protein
MEVNMEIRFKSYSSDQERAIRQDFVALYSKCPIPQNELMSNLALFTSRQELSHMLFIDEIYQRILDVAGIIVEFGVRWGRNLALFESFRGIYEPYNYTRKLVGFDTFAGFPSISTKDGASEIAAVGSYAVTKNYDSYLTSVLEYHEQESPLSHIKKFELIAGDASVEVDRYLDRHPETIIALAYFDFDLYEPTKKCLQAIRPHLTKGSVIGFDELNNRDFPGETLALKEVLGLDKYRIMRSRYDTYPTFLIID